MSVGGRRELAEVSLGAPAGTIRDETPILLRLLDAQIRSVDQELARRWSNDPRVQRLQTIPGVGPFVAILLVLELADIACFPSAKHVASYIG